ncbi:MAG: hypothetical protein GC137_02740 [Alphaproteobacteria bacterium]|nr:hypothetical protein [Alphaproteobacteria bacterium]
MPKSAKKRAEPDLVEQFRRTAGRFINADPREVVAMIRHHDKSFGSRADRDEVEATVWDCLMLEWAKKNDPKINAALLKSHLLSDEARALAGPQ